MLSIRVTSKLVLSAAFLFSCGMAQAASISLFQSDQTQAGPITNFTIGDFQSVPVSFPFNLTFTAQNVSPAASSANVASLPAALELITGPAGGIIPDSFQPSCTPSASFGILRTPTPVSLQCVIPNLAQVLNLSQGGATVYIGFNLNTLANDVHVTYAAAATAVPEPMPVYQTAIGLSIVAALRLRRTWQR